MSALSSVDFSPQFLIVITKVEFISLMVYVWTTHSISTMSYLSVNKAHVCK
jgi:hypothetical protein